jgi:hypothetical protein
MAQPKVRFFSVFIYQSITTNGKKVAIEEMLIDISKKSEPIFKDTFLLNSFYFFEMRAFSFSPKTQSSK